MIRSPFTDLFKKASTAGSRGAMAGLLLMLLIGMNSVLAAPNMPVMIFPASNTVNVGDSPPLKVRVSEPGAGNVTVRFFGRLAKSPGRDFTVVAMPDTQCYSGEINGGKKEMMIAQTQWSIANRESRNVAYVAQLGDISNNGDTPSYVFQWYNATNAMYRLESAAQTQLPFGMPYGVAVGNHEQTPNGNADSGSTSNYNKYFGVSHFTGKPYYSGHYGINNNNHFDFFSVSGLDFITIYFEYDASMSASVLAWANEVLRTNANRRAILVTHYFGSARTPSTFSTQGAAIYNALKTNANLFLMLSGHVCGEGSRSDTFNGNTAYTLVSDYQCYPGGGNGFMRLMEFSPSNNVVVVQTYSPWLNEYETDYDSEFFFPYDMPPAEPSNEPFRELHIESAVPSGSIAGFVWNGLMPYRNYEWYVTVTDSPGNTVTGPVWNFTTAKESGARHDVAAAQIAVSQVPGFSGPDENLNCTVTQTFLVNDLRAGSFNRGDYNVQVGPDGSQNAAKGVLISSVMQNGRDNYGTNLFGTSAIELNGDGTYRVATYSSANVSGAAGAGYGYEYNLNISAAWFPYGSWLGGYVRNTPGTNGGVWNAFTGSPGLILGTHIKSTGTGTGIVDLRSKGIDSRYDGVLLVSHARDEGNFALSQVNTNDGTWNVFVKDNSAYTAGEYEQDPLAFVFVPRTNTAVVLGRFLADGTIDAYSADQPMFSVKVLGTGRWELKITGRSPSEGALIISAEGGGTYNLDNLVSCQENADGDGWEIQSRDTPGNALQTPTAKEGVVSFVFIPSLRPGIAISPNDDLATVEGGSNTFHLLLDTRPVADVSISLVSSDLSEGTVSPAVLTFTTNDWHVPQTVTITGVDDSLLDGNIPYTIVLTVSSADTNYSVQHPGPLSIVNFDNEPQLFMTSSQVSYGIGMPGISLDGSAALVDPATSSYGGATLTVTITNAAPDDRLLIRNIGNGSGQVGVSGNTVKYAGTVVAGFTGGIGSAPLVITFNPQSTPTAVQAVLRAITFSNGSPNPALWDRDLGISLVKADRVTVSGGLSVRVGLVRVAEFQQGVDHGYGTYSGAADCELYAAAPTSAYPTGHGRNYAIWMDAATVNTAEGAEALLRFTGISGTGLGQIPPDATIVGAELVLTIPPDVSNSPGDGSPLFRMLVTWNPNTATWNSFGGTNGVVPNNIHARSNFTSCIGLSNGDASTGTGQIRFSVTPDVIAWVNGGETNCGWAMPGWQPPYATAPRADGTCFAGCRWPVQSERPLLRVLWLPKGTPAASFRRGVDGYTGAQDTRIRQSEPSTIFATTPSMFSDWSVAGSGDNEQVLFRFDNIFGTAPGQIVPGSRIDAAILDLASVVGNAMGDGGRFYRVLQPWQDTCTWSSWGNGIQTDGIEAASSPTALAGNVNLAPDVQAGYLSFDLTADVQIWSYMPSSNNGWVIVPWPNGTDAWGFASAEAALAGDRPRLRVFYTTPSGAAMSVLPPVANGRQLQIRFTGIVGTACTVERAATPGGPWSSLGSAIVSQDGIAAFPDPAPLPTGAFYRVRFP